MSPAALLGSIEPSTPALLALSALLGIACGTLGSAASRGGRRRDRFGAGLSIAVVALVGAGLALMGWRYLEVEGADITASADAPLNIEVLPQPIVLALIPVTAIGAFIIVACSLDWAHRARQARRILVAGALPAVLAFSWAGAIAVTGEPSVLEDPAAVQVLPKWAAPRYGTELAADDARDLLAGRTVVVGESAVHLGGSPGALVLIDQSGAELQTERERAELEAGQQAEGDSERVTVPVR
ncbi:hypothetical protein Bequi_09955 [Brachybacterium sp. JHP9]|uniref:Uncharacterized protein n=1 Tax=Brachybacterium equifaecis TaxID=2910770 RepID=A0ABT0R1A8_9MICO|nr:hypothetical protein [Brachybacterium equifaecis]MCL6423707.1 hypothetical protein [Brachybacterium equifaecis]